MKKIPVGLLGATGMVGQQYLTLLAQHPWFEVAFFASSENSAGKSYREAVKGRWHHPHVLSEKLLNLPVHRIDEISKAKESCQFVFSAVTHDAAKVYEERYAEEGIPVISNAGYHRQSPDVPILIPEVNAHHLEIIPIQQKNRKWKTGFIVVKPNCSVQSYLIPLAPLHREYQIERLHVTTLQAMSGAGYPGISSLDILDNAIPYIAQEEEKCEKEPLKIWGHIQHNSIHPIDTIAISAHCNRIPVKNGHLACVSVKFKKKPTKNEILALWKSSSSDKDLPSAPEQLIVYREENERPQPHLDNMTGNGMSVTVGRLRECPVFDYRFVALSHNVIRGAAGGGILNAELLVKNHFLKK